MTATLNDVTAKKKRAGQSAEQLAAAELVRRPLAAVQGHWRDTAGFRLRVSSGRRPWTWEVPTSQSL
jgi:hypothetical protein